MAKDRPGELTFAQIRNLRRQALREVRRRERNLDTQIEVIERAIFRKLGYKNAIMPADGREIAGYIQRLYPLLYDLAKAAADFYIVLVN